MPTRFLTGMPHKRRKKLYRFSIKIDIPNKNAIQIRNLIEGAIRSSTKAPKMTYKLYNDNGTIRVQAESIIASFIQKEIKTHYKQYLLAKGLRVKSAPDVMQYKERELSFVGFCYWCCWLYCWNAFRWLSAKSFQMSKRCLCQSVIKNTKGIRKRGQRYYYNRNNL